MAKKDQRVPHDVLHRQAQLAVLGAMVRGEDLDGLTAAVALSEVPHWFTPEAAVLELAVTALELAAPPGTDRPASPTAASGCGSSTRPGGRVDPPLRPRASGWYGER